MYILARVVAMSTMSLFHESYHILRMVYLLFVLFDICVYIPSSRAFYVLLKGRRDEALYHSSRLDYLGKRKIAKQFFYSQISTFFGLFLVFLYYTSLCSLSVSIFYQILVSLNVFYLGSFLDSPFIV